MTDYPGTHWGEAPCVSNSNFKIGGGKDAAAGFWVFQVSSVVCPVRSNTLFSSFTVHQAGKDNPQTI